MRFPLDTLAISLLALICLALFGKAFLADHPEHDPWAPLSLDHPPGWATATKLATLRADPAVCRSFLARSAIGATPLPTTGSGQCRRDDRQVLSSPASANVLLAPRGPQATCAVDAGLALWLRQGVQPAAQTLFGSPVARIEHFGTSSCRRIGNGGQWSEHATGNAIDISAFVLADGRRIVVRTGWTGPEDAAAFLRTVRDSACRSYATVLSPDYNAAHADHLHLDQANRSGGWTVCR